MANAARRRNNSNVEVADNRLATFKPLDPHTVFGFNNYERAKAVWWEKAVAWIRQSVPGLAVLDALMQLRRNSIPSILEDLLVHFALYKTRYPICPGELQLEADHPGRGVLCQICWRHHPEVEGVDRHGSRQWTLDTMELAMRRRWHGLSGNAKQPSIDKYNEVVRVRMGDVNQLKRLLNVHDTLDKELMENGPDVYLGEWYYQKDALKNVVKREPIQIELPRQPEGFASSSTSGGKPNPNAIPLQPSFNHGYALPPNPVEQTLSGVSMPRLPSATPPPAAAAKQSSSGPIPTGPRYGSVWGSKATLERSTSSPKPAEPVTESPLITPTVVKVEKKPPSSPSEARLQDPRVKEIKNRVVPVHHLQPAPAKSAGMISNGDNESDNDEQDMEIEVEVDMGATEQRARIEADLRAASDEINLVKSSDSPRPAAVQIEIPAELRSLKLTGEVTGTAVLQSLMDMMSTTEKREAEWKAKEIKWEEDKVRWLSKEAQHQTQWEKMYAEIKRLRRERDSLREDMEVCRADRTRFKNRYERAEADRKELEARLDKLER